MKTSKEIKAMLNIPMYCNVVFGHVQYFRETWLNINRLAKNLTRLYVAARLISWNT